MAGPPPASSQPNEMSPVPPARSSRVCRFVGASTPMKIFFHNRWMPRDIRSFMRSYLVATLSKTARTIGFLSSRLTRRKPKSISSGAEVSGKPGLSLMSASV